MPISRIPGVGLDTTGTASVNTFLRGDNAWSGTITSGTAVSASGTSVDFTGIPSTAKRITVMLNGISTNGTSPIQIQIGSGSVATSGYFANWAAINGGTAQGNVTTGFYASGGSLAASVTTGQLILSLISSNTWVATGLFLYTNNAGAVIMVSGNVTLSGAIDRARLTTVNGTDTFDAGTINIMWES